MGPWWVFERGRRLPARLFRPVPSVDAAVLTAVRRVPPLLEPAVWDAYRDFLRQAFQHRHLEDFLRARVGTRAAARLGRHLRLAADLEPPQLTVREWTELFVAARHPREARTQAPRASS